MPFSRASSAACEPCPRRSTRIAATSRCVSATTSDGSRRGTTRMLPAVIASRLEPATPPSCRSTRRARSTMSSARWRNVSTSSDANRASQRRKTVLTASAAPSSDPFSSCLELVRSQQAVEHQLVSAEDLGQTRDRTARLRGVRLPGAPRPRSPARGGSAPALRPPREAGSALPRRGHPECPRRSMRCPPRVPRRSAHPAA